MIGIVQGAAGPPASSGLGLEAATITPEGDGDVGQSTNRILREEIRRRPAEQRQIAPGKPRR